MYRVVYEQTQNDITRQLNCPGNGKNSVRSARCASRTCMIVCTCMYEHCVRVRVLCAPPNYYIKWNNF